MVPDEVIAAIDRALPILETTEDMRFVTSAQLLRGIIEHGRGRLASGSTWYARAFENARSNDIPRAEAQAAGALGDVLLSGPMPADEAIARLRASLDDARGNRVAEIEVGLRLGGLLLRSGSREEGGCMIERVRADAVDLGYRTGVLMLDFFMAIPGWSGSGDLAESEQKLRRLCEEEADDIGFLSTTLAEHALTLCGLEHFEEAEAVARKSLEITAPGDLYSAVASRAALARSVAHRRSTDEGFRIAREAVALTDETEWLDLRITALRALADVLRLMGREDEAAQALRSCIAMYVAKGFSWSAEQIRAELAGPSTRRPSAVEA